MTKHELAVERAISTRLEAGLDFSAVYAGHFAEVCRWLRAMGGPEADLEDLAQEVFLVVRRRLADFDGGNMRGWLYRIARNVAGDYRRRLFFRQLFHKRYEDTFDETWDVGDAPDRRYDEREARRTVTRVLARMGAKKRTVFVLFEIEGYSSEEIGRLEGIPEATVRTRLFHARRDFPRAASTHEPRDRMPARRWPGRPECRRHADPHPGSRGGSRPASRPSRRPRSRLSRAR